MLSVSALFTLHLLHFCVCVCSLLALFVGLLFVDVWDGVLSETMRSLPPLCSLSLGFFIDGTVLFSGAPKNKIRK